MAAVKFLIIFDLTWLGLYTIVQVLLKLYFEMFSSKRNLCKECLIGLSQILLNDPKV